MALLNSRERVVRLIGPTTYVEGSICFPILCLDSSGFINRQNDRVCSVSVDNSLECSEFRVSFKFSENTSWSANLYVPCKNSLNDHSCFQIQMLKMPREVPTASLADRDVSVNECSVQFLSPYSSGKSRTKSSNISPLTFPLLHRLELSPVYT